MADLIKAMLATGYHSPYSPDFASSEFHLLGPMKVHLGEQKFQTGKEFKCNVLDWLRSKNRPSYVALSNLPGRWENMLA
jgi:hypothetical protein